MRAREAVSTLETLFSLYENAGADLQMQIRDAISLLVDDTVSRVTDKAELEGFEKHYLPQVAKTRLRIGLQHTMK